jgi:hypothetical protein
MVCNACNSRGLWERIVMIARIAALAGAVGIFVMLWEAPAHSARLRQARQAVDLPLDPKAPPRLPAASPPSEPASPSPPAFSPETAFRPVSIPFRCRRPFHLLGERRNDIWE